MTLNTLAQIIAGATYPLAILLVQFRRWRVRRAD